MIDEPKTALTPVEKIKAAYLHLVRGVTQQDIAVAFEVNSGRVNEAIMDVRAAVGMAPDKGPPSEKV
jgi:DNA-directed RNA polymerase specialized sigma24 family protein